MGRYLCIYISLLFTISLQAQWGSQQVITTSDDGVFKAYPYDMDKDGDMDVVSASYSSDSVFWYENLDGLGNFSAANLITDAIITLEDMQLFDVNGDNSKDIVVKNLANDYIVWLENLDDQGNFGSPQIMYQGNYCYFFNMDDLDGDDDLDLIATLSSPPFYNKLVWFENINGLGSFGPEQIIMDEVGYEPQFSSTIDIDNDGDRDMLLGYYFLQSSKLVWFENNGSGSFSESQILLNLSPIISDFRRIGRTVDVDMDNDGLVDILFHTGHPEGTDNINWIRNVDGNGTFSNTMMIHEEVNFIDRSMNVFDLDQDGDLDILFAEGHEDKIYWFENTDGLGSFGPTALITDELEEVTYADASDFNGDGQLDIISASSSDGTIAWYEYGGLGIMDSETHQILISPNPTRNDIRLSRAFELRSVTAITPHGSMIPLTWDGQHIQTSMLHTGFYILKLKTTEGYIHTLKLIKE